MSLSQQSELAPKNALVQAIIESVVVVGLLIFLASPLIGVVYKNEFSKVSTIREYPAVATPSKKN